jgi:hypothetical protein
MRPIQERWEVRRLAEAGLNLSQIAAASGIHAAIDRDWLSGRSRSYPRYPFTNASKDIRELFCDALRQVGVSYTRPKERVISIARADSVHILDGFVGPKA